MIGSDQYVICTQLVHCKWQAEIHFHFKLLNALLKGIQRNGEVKFYMIFRAVTFTSISTEKGVFIMLFCRIMTKQSFILVKNIGSGSHSFDSL